MKNFLKQETTQQALTHVHWLIGYFDASMKKIKLQKTISVKENRLTFFWRAEQVHRCLTGINAVGAGACRW